MSTAAFLARKIDAAMSEHAREHGPEAAGPSMYFVLTSGQQIYGDVRAASEDVIELQVRGATVFLNPSKVIAWSTSMLEAHPSEIRTQS